MKLKQIEKLLKRAKTIHIFNADDGQWLSDGVAVYPIYGLPHLDEDNIFGMFDIPEDKRDAFRCQEHDLPNSVNFGDFDRNERILDRGDISIVMRGEHLEPLFSSHGLIFINSRYLYTPTRRTQRSEKSQYDAWEQACRQRWRALKLVIQAKLEAVECGISVFEDEFMANIVVAGGKTVSEYIRPQLADAYEHGSVPQLIPQLTAGVEILP